MTDRTLRPGTIAAAAVAIGGILIMAMPQHSLSIVRLVIVTSAAAAGLFALRISVPRTWWTSPFDGRVPQVEERARSDDIDRVRSMLAGRRQPIENGPPLPAAAIRLLKPLIGVSIERKGLDPSDQDQLESARGLVSPLTWAVFTSDPLLWPRWYQTRWPNEQEVADVAHKVLDDLDRMAGGGWAPEPHTRNRSPGAE